MRLAPRWPRAPRATDASSAADRQVALYPACGPVAVPSVVAATVVIDAGDHGGVEGVADDVLDLHGSASRRSHPMPCAEHGRLFGVDRERGPSVAVPGRSEASTAGVCERVCVCTRTGPGRHSPL